MQTQTSNPHLMYIIRLMVEIYIYLKKKLITSCQIARSKGANYVHKTKCYHLFVPVRLFVLHYSKASSYRYPFLRLTFISFKITHIISKVLAILKILFTAIAMSPVTIPALITNGRYLASKVKYWMEGGFSPFFKGPTCM